MRRSRSSWLAPQVPPLERLAWVKTLVVLPRAGIAFARKCTVVRPYAKVLNHSRGVAKHIIVVASVFDLAKAGVSREGEKGAGFFASGR